MKHYYVNDDRTNNPGWHHEVHTEEHANTLGIKNKSYLGYYSSCRDAIEKARNKYIDTDGCAICCTACHTG